MSCCALYLYELWKSLLFGWTLSISPLSQSWSSMVNTLHPSGSTVDEAQGGCWDKHVQCGRHRTQSYSTGICGRIIACWATFVCGLLIRAHLSWIWYGYDQHHKAQYPNFIHFRACVVFFPISLLLEQGYRPMCSVLRPETFILKVTSKTPAHESWRGSRCPITR